MSAGEQGPLSRQADELIGRWEEIERKREARHRELLGMLVIGFVITFMLGSIALWLAPIPVYVRLGGQAAAIAFGVALMALAIR